jgi:hypothetical protein
MASAILAQFGAPARPARPYSSKASESAASSSFVQAPTPAMPLSLGSKTCLNLSLHASGMRDSPSCLETSTQ